MNKEIIKKINWQKIDGLIPAIVQDINTNRVLMLGYMNKKAMEKTLDTGKVWFFSRSKQRLWMKGEKSKNYLLLKNISLDCDNDTLLIKAKPAGPTCHSGSISCFGIEKNNKEVNINIIAELYSLIEDRKQKKPDKSYTASLFKAGTNKINAKIMEEAEEICRAARDETKKRVIEESVDVLYHLIVLLVQKDTKLKQILKEIKTRRKK